MARLIKILCSVMGLVIFLACGPLARTLQQPAPPVPPTDESSSTHASTPKPKKYSHANDFLIRGTVFDNNALSLPGAQLRLRRSGERKSRWESYTNSRGEFAIRVPQGSEYEMIVHMKGYADQTRTVNAKNGGGDEGFVFRMEPLGDRR